jgi:N-methylhydantoinase B
LAGAGRQRGGATLGLALTPHDTDELRAMIVGHGVEVPNSVGLFGGMEGSCNRNGMLHAVEGMSPIGVVTGPEDLAQWPGEQVEFDAKPGFFALRHGDTLAYSFQGGGGMGDPIDREPREVAEDVIDDYVSREAAAKIYGVLLDGDDGVDKEATAVRRNAIRAERVGHAVPADVAAAPSTGRVLTPSLRLADDGTVQCRCGFSFGPGPDWKPAAASRVVDPHEHGSLVKLHVELELREHSCPSCGTLLESEIARIGAPNLVTIELA